MGTKRVGLARIETLIENLKRSLNLNNTTLTDCVVSTTGSVTMNGAVSSNYIRFATQDWHGLSLSTKSDANCDSGFTMAANTLHECAALGDAANAIVLPDADPGTLCVWRYTAQADGGSNITFTCASGDFYQAQTINMDVANVGDAHPFSRWIKSTDTTQTVATFAGSIITAAATHNTLTYAHTATNNQTNVGAEIAFFCQTDGYWRIAWQGSELGSGALNASFAFSTV